MNDGNAGQGFEPVNQKVERKTGFEPVTLSLTRRWASALCFLRVDPKRKAYSYRLVRRSFS